MVGISNEDQLPGDEIVRLTFFHLGDAAALCDMDADPEHRRRFEFPETFVASLAHSQKVISDWTNQRDDGPFVFAVRGVSNGELLGGCEIRLLADHVANLSYWTVPQHRARGVASRAVALASQIAAQLDVRRIEVVVDPDNFASRRVAMHNGFREAGTRNDRIVHVKDMSILPVDPPNKAIT